MEKVYYYMEGRMCMISLRYRVETELRVIRGARYVDHNVSVECNEARDKPSYSDGYLIVLVI